jgi:hypothetical protein
MGQAKEKWSNVVYKRKKSAFCPGSGLSGGLFVGGMNKKI